MCTTFYSQALDATETTTTIETMGDIEFRRKQKARDLCAKWAQNRRFAQKAKVEKDASDGNKRRADYKIGQLRNGEKKGSARASLYTHSE